MRLSQQKVKLNFRTKLSKIYYKLFLANFKITSFLILLTPHLFSLLLPINIFPFMFDSIYPNIRTLFIYLKYENNLIESESRPVIHQNAKSYLFCCKSRDKRQSMKRINKDHSNSFINRSLILSS